MAVLLALVYGLYEARLSPWMGAAYSSLSHSAWALGLAWIVVACVTGYGGNVISKFSYVFVIWVNTITSGLLKKLEVSIFLQFNLYKGNGAQ